MNGVNRRQFIVGAGGLALGVAATAGISALITPETAASELPWTYQTLDPVAAAERAYTAYSDGGCMYGAFEGIIGELRDQVGEPYKSFPAAMMKYGGAGVAGWGTLCGALNGAAAAIAVVVPADSRNSVIGDLYAWYGSEPLPDYKPQSPKFASIPTSTAESQLCHISVTKWCNASGFKATSPERAERCAWLTAAVVKYTVEALNKQAAGAFAVTHTVPAAVKSCLACHGKGGIKENVHATSQSSCVSCHFDIGSGHPAA